MSKYGQGFCGDCGRPGALKKDGTVRAHGCRPVATEVCEACNERVPVREDGVIGTHLKDIESGEICDGSPAEALPESEGPAPFGGEHTNEDCADRFQLCASCGETEADHGGLGSACYWSPSAEDPSYCEERDHCCRTHRSDGSIACDHCGEATSPPRKPCVGIPVPDPHAVPVPFTATAADVAQAFANISPDKAGGAAQTAAEERALRVAQAFMGHNTRRAAIARPTSADAAQAFLEGGEPGTYVNVSGQPRAKTNRRGYLITDPATGEFRRYKNGNIIPYTRCTTVIKATADTASLGDWQERNVLIGAAKRPDIAARAHGLTHEDNRDELDRIVDELSTVAGAKIAANQGTEFHEITERYDGGQMTLEQCPPYWATMLRLYVEALEHYGLEPVPGLIERTTMTHQYGEVAGTFDRVLYHRTSGTYLMADLKSGKGALDYGRQEIPAQLAIYTEGVNANGVYDWNTDTWRRLEHPVRTDWGIVMHSPLQGPMAHTVEFYPADLRKGREDAQECADVRRRRSEAPKFVPLDAALLGVRDWDTAFGSVQTPEAASKLYGQARKAGIKGLELQRLVGLAQTSLAKLGYPAR